MFRVFQEEKVVAIGMFTCLGASILFRVLLGMLYRNMIKEADNMASTENRLLKQCKTKFASCYQLSNGVANIPVFVDKFLNRMALGHMTFETMYHLSGQLMLLSVVFSGIGVCRSIMSGRTLGDVMPFYIVSFFGLYLFFSVSTVVDVKGKRRILKVNLVDYLENHLSPRIDITRQDIEMLYGESVFEEKRGIYESVQGGRKDRNRIRRNGRAVQQKSEGRRTVELMPIGNRLAVNQEKPLAAGGEDAAAMMREPEEPGRRQGEYAFGGDGIGYPGRTGASGSMEEAGSAAGIRASGGEDTGFSGGSTAAASPEESDSAAVTEEELEALLKEFLTS